MSIITQPSASGSPMAWGSGGQPLAKISASIWLFYIGMCHMYDIIRPHILASQPPKNVISLNHN